MSKSNFIMKPKIDFCFKELMEDRITRLGFISALLNVSPEEIEDIELLPTILRQEHEEDKFGILDVRVKLKSGTQIDMEMQVAPFPEWEKRTLFYLCKMFTDQLHTGEPYDNLKKCIHVGLLDFILFEGDPEFYSRFHIWEDRRRRQYSDELEIHVLEFPKLKDYDDPADELVKWAKFFNAENEEEFKMLAQENEYLNRAYEKLKEISADEQKRLEYETREKNIRDYEWQMSKSREYGFKKGFQDGFRDGQTAGFQDGNATGFQNGRATAICDLLEELSPVPEDLKKVIFSEKDPDVLKKWLSLAAKSESVDQFEHAIKNI